MNYEHLSESWKSQLRHRITEALRPTAKLSANGEVVFNFPGWSRAFGGVGAHILKRYADVLADVHRLQRFTEAMEIERACRALVTPANSTEARSVASEPFPTPACTIPEQLQSTSDPRDRDGGFDDRLWRESAKQWQEDAAAWEAGAQRWNEELQLRESAARKAESAIVRMRSTQRATPLDVLDGPEGASTQSDSLVTLSAWIPCAPDIPHDEDVELSLGSDNTHPIHPSDTGLRPLILTRRALGVPHSWSDTPSGNVSGDLREPTTVESIAVRQAWRREDGPPPQSPSHAQSTARVLSQRQRERRSVQSRVRNIERSTDV